MVHSDGPMVTPIIDQALSTFVELPISFLLPRQESQKIEIKTEQGKQSSLEETKRQYKKKENVKCKKVNEAKLNYRR